MADYGRQLLKNSGAGIEVSYDGRPEWKAGGLTIDWSTVAAIAGADYTIPLDLEVVPIGQKYLRYGQVLTKISNAPVQTVTLNGVPTGGTFTLTVFRPDTGGFVTTAPLAYNASAAAVLAALVAVLGSEVAVSVTLAAGPPPVYTITFGLIVPLLVATDSTTGGTHSIAVAVTNAGGNHGMFGPYDSAAGDGRQTLTRGECFILNQTVLQGAASPRMPTGPTDHPPALEGGMVWKSRILQSGVAAHSLAAGPTLAELLAAFPRLRLVEN
jgi:hypothetical protein